MTFFRPLILVFLFSLFNSISFSQEPTRCGTDDIITKQLQDPKFARSYNQIVKLKHSQQQKALSNDILTIPVVVHVFHDGDDYGTGSNIADEVIYDAIANLNACFAGEPWHTAQGAPFLHPYSDSNIEFCLASIDPDGNVTTGITRHNPDSLGTYTTQGMITTSILPANSETALKELSVWDTEKYCNVWVLHKLNGGSSPLGFAYLPPTSGDHDGIVCYVNVFGFEEPWLLYNFNKNGTLVHEMGHYLGLRHTFNNTADCNPISPITGEPYNCLTQGDMLCDTPPTTGSVGCSPISCPETMVENFMDYSNDNCMDRFSPDGVTRMRTQLLAYRPELLDPTNIACGASDGIDVSASNIFIPTQGTCTELYEGMTFTMSSFSLDTITSVEVTYQINNGNPVSFIWTGEITLGNPVTVEMPGIDAPYGENSIIISLSNPNSVTDTNPDNDTTQVDFINNEGTDVNIIAQWDALPYGIEIRLFNADSIGNAIGGSIFYYDNTDNNLSCTVDTFSFCLPEGNYVVVAEDLFGNGMHYPCQFDTRCILVEIDGELVDDNSLCGGWSNGDNIPFTISLGCPPLGDCPWDIDGDGIVAVSDIIIILQNFGLFYECSPMDFDQDGVIGVNDLLDAISVFGLTCSTGMVLDVEIPNSIIDRLNTLGVSPIYKDEAISKIVYYNIYGAVIDYNDMIPSGIYIRQIEFESGRVEVKKIIR